MHCNLAAIKTLSWQCYSCAEVSTSWSQPASMGSRLYVCVGPSSTHSIFKGRQVIVTRSKMYINIIVTWISRVHVQFLCHCACASSDTPSFVEVKAFQWNVRGRNFWKSVRCCVQLVFIVLLCFLQLMVYREFFMDTMQMVVAIPSVLGVLCINCGSLCMLCKIHTNTDEYWVDVITMGKGPHGQRISL